MAVSVGTKITVRYAETDQMGIVHHSVYPIWYEVARTNFIKQYGITYSNLEKSGLMMPLTNLTCNYKLPAHYEDELLVKAKVLKISCAKMLFGYDVYLEKENKLLSSGTTEHGFVNSKTFKPINIKKFDKELYEKLSDSI